MIEIKTGIRLAKEDVLDLLNYFDDSSDHPLHDGLDFEIYSDKLSTYAYFIVAYLDEKCVGFIAYYLNEEGRFAYIPQTVVHKDGRHRGVGHTMFEALYKSIMGEYLTIRLEVLKSNTNARNFYTREGFVAIEDHNERLLLENKL